MSVPPKSNPSELREFIKENDQRLYDFCFFMSCGAYPVEEVVLSTFREFGDRIRKGAPLLGNSEQTARKLRLFRVAWEAVQDAADSQRPTWSVGRDTRPLKSLDEDLLASARLKGFSIEKAEPMILERLSRVDLEFRAPLVLRDILKFSDEEVVSILGLRWGVYRHRLHRARMELASGLKGRMEASRTESLET